MAAVLRHCSSLEVSSLVRVDAMPVASTAFGRPTRTRNTAASSEHRWTCN